MAMQPGREVEGAMRRCRSKRPPRSRAVLRSFVYAASARRQGQGGGGGRATRFSVVGAVAAMVGFDAGAATFFSTFADLKAGQEGGSKTKGDAKTGLNAKD